MIDVGLSYVTRFGTLGFWLKKGRYGVPKEIYAYRYTRYPYTPRGILDRSSVYINLGCGYLLTKVKQIKPKFHIFGHIHASYGIKEIDRTTFINASNYNSREGLVNPPIVFTLN